MGHKKWASEELEGPVKGIILEQEMDLAEGLQELILDSNKAEVRASLSFQTPPISQTARDSSANRERRRLWKKVAIRVKGISILERGSSLSRSTRRLSQDFHRAEKAGHHMPPPLL